VSDISILQVVTKWAPWTFPGTMWCLWPAWVYTSAVPRAVARFPNNIYPVSPWLHSGRLAMLRVEGVPRARDVGLDFRASHD
jgi:hypothetical protein